jgi:hypothetical protein
MVNVMGESFFEDNFCKIWERSPRRWFTFAIDIKVYFFKGPNI